MSRQAITELIAHTKTVTAQGPVFAQPFEQRTENPRVESSVITPVSMHPEGFDVLGFFYVRWFSSRGYSCLFDLRIFWIFTGI